MDAAVSGAMGGPLFEGLIVSESLKIASTHRRSCDISFWRSHDGMEVDLILTLADRLVPIEVKLTASPTLHHGNSLTRFQQIAGSPQTNGGILVCRVKQPIRLPHHNQAIPWTDYSRWLDAQLSSD